ncbi:palmitoyl-protein thioesterase precursor [Ascobolus immersus RN42]|uniref:Palmitoyl-protein thioesterase 1 n=1 Tax=Ascobolus immersus RN42 TaxID=1160509 RepID=A0A3N4I7Q3_ASCIM|nr:palmitoyl-protein thioesterase precursor [Ascobolus immersus RN42]
MRYLSLLLSALIVPALASPAPAHPDGKKPLPLVIWHGLGDTYDSEGMVYLAEIAERANPGTFVYPIRLSSDPNTDRQLSYFGRVDSQIHDVCEQLSSIPELSQGFNALGFSQGGQFLRGYIERCNFPPVHTLVTYGSQHNGVSEFVAACRATDWLCKSAAGLLQRGAFQRFVQTRLVPAQYYRDPERLEEYLEESAFLADINNERPDIRESGGNDEYKWRLSELKRFVMVMFEEDELVVPKESAWFQEVIDGNVTKLEDRPMIKEDWIGLKKLVDEGRISYELAKGGHMELDEEDLEGMFKKYFGSGSELGSEEV